MTKWLVKSESGTNNSGDQTEIEKLLDELQRAKSRCRSGFGPDIKVGALVGVLLFGMIAISQFNIPIFCVSSAALLVVSRLWRRKRIQLEHEHADQYRTVFRFSTRLAVALESQVTPHAGRYTRDSLDMLEQAAADAANPEGVHYHSRLAKAALRTLKSVGDDKTVNKLSTLVGPQRCSDEHERVMEALLDCISGINGRLYRRTGGTTLLRPMTTNAREEQVLMRPAGSKAVLSHETLLRTTVDSTGGSE